MHRYFTAALACLSVSMGCSAPPSPQSPTPESSSPAPTGPITSPTPAAVLTPTATAEPTLAPTPPPSPTPQPTPLLEQNSLVQTSAGPVEGHPDAENTLAWLGIPFAAPPVGALRWQAPIPPEPWTSTRVADTFGPRCPQVDDMDSDGDGNVEYYVYGDEDCLQLNLWRPRSEASRLRPVMLWIHGGGNVQGSATDSIYHGPILAAKADVLLVTVQYRLSIFGYFQHEALHTGDPLTDSGNFGTLDLIRALQWVRDNAAAFGGDASRVTVFGESAGGVNTWAMQLSPLAQGLFHGAIAQSGCYSSQSMGDARALAQTVLEGMVVDDGLATADTAAAYLEQLGTQGIRSYLYGKSWYEIIDYFAKYGGIPLSTYKPIRDGVVFRDGGLQDMVDGNYNRAPFIVGANAEEQKYFYSSYSGMTDLEYNVIMRSVFGDDLDDIEALYPREGYSPATPYNQAIGILDFTFESVCSEHAAITIASYQPTWLYHFRFAELEPPYDYAYGAAHGFEIPFVFGNMNTSLYPVENLAARTLLSEQMIHYWSCFAYTQNPSCEMPLFSSGPQPPEWLPIQSARDQYHRILLDTPITSEVLPDVNIDRMNYWNTLYGIGLPPVGAARHQATVREEH